MGWVKITPARGSRLSKPDVTLSCRARGNAQILSMLVRASSGVYWWEVGRRVDVALGDGSDKGQLRVTRSENGAFVIGKHVAKGGALKGSLSIPATPGLAPGAHKPTAVDWDHGDDWLVITLPAWAHEVEVLPAAKVIPGTSVVSADLRSVSPAKSKPFSMSSTYDPVAEGRRGSSPIPSKAR